MTLAISSVSLEYVRVQVTALKSGSSVNPTGDVVQMAFTGVGVLPVSGDWKTASWETTPQNAYYAKCLVGSGGAVTLAAGRYDIWVKVTDSPEVPVKLAGQLLVT